MTQTAKKIAALWIAIMLVFTGMAVSNRVDAASSGFIAASSKTAMSRLGKGAENLNPHKTVKVYNFQGRSAAGYSVTMSKSDIAILKDFADNHFTSSMTPAQKVATTMEWIHMNVKYATTSADYARIAGQSWVSSIFKYKTGQCAQYNGALICMMAYLGYDASMVQGFRSSKGRSWQHFWGQVKIDGVTYLVEAGNRGKSGNWYYLCAKYSETKGYVY